LTESNGITTLEVNMDIVDTHKDYFLKTWPKALAQVKILAEDR